jgi:O-antigen/teichoic acid export membrane protein
MLSNPNLHVAGAATADPNPDRPRSRLGQFSRLLEPSLRQRIVNGAAWSIAGAGLANGLTMISHIATARFLGTTHYGEFAIVLATTNLFTTVFTSGLGMTATRYVAEHRNSDPRRAGTVIGLSWVTSIVVGAATTFLMLLLAPWLSRETLGAPQLSNALSLGAVALFFAALNGSQTGTLSGLEAFNLIALGNLFRGAGIVLLVTAGAALGGVTGALLGYVTVGALMCLFYQIAVRRECASRSIVISYHFRQEDFCILSRFTLPAVVTALSFTPAVWWSNVLLTNTKGFSETGVFNAVLHWQMLMLFFSSAISNLGLPMLSSVRAERDSAKYKTCLVVNLVLTSVPALAIAIPVATCSRFIMRLYGLGFEHGATALALISLAAVLSAINIPVGHAIWSLDATGPAVLLAGLRGGVLVLASYILAGKGATGLAGAYVAMGIVQTVATIPIMLWTLRRKLAQPASPEVVVTRWRSWT